jgi:hypothetical protein
VLVNSTAGLTSVLPCQPSTNKSVCWSKVPETGSPIPIVDNDIVINGFNVRFSLKKNGNARRDLEVRNTQKLDGGLYRCKEDGGIGKSHDIRLIVRGIYRHLPMNHYLKIIIKILFPEMLKSYAKSRMIYLKPQKLSNNLAGHFVPCYLDTKIEITVLYVALLTDFVPSFFKNKNKKFVRITGTDPESWNNLFKGMSV